ncbi:hypothetical protein COW36_05415 [bacterium (Candidatus Blackallbacteria) CG17_big_fil_post_rev_8_21_14_2_50_48_46]|uniref:Gamma-glutamylcyclotransferase family protein n=1 Tax=bacterium (Candidatus Blackallbacteria) CG17_big_fil_post_rev_8_21_14_2_50_48_46 TaxID=2014261 RepID=A0A2M7G7Z4_9BACT|nr:MAG: hypothetical protein COW64_21010 [bacterium (Candidatus Blackallbacteria) CG18_big_fil_WC_8_21_14_2_50_49_26]PIW18207.1 MAG: hypothetical protein COW36_05415 [bacterium (Candidatus Blackallbacteria) CG17_big_fil_post_rev_8_21_14_2_50_48_46]PIW50638.1 MAG: hypothetical protein COW20_01680 [bacterium (Candidatus Blackallbacteria) CG13_big_fil_rev_8_21_14_2_50_49_14]
MEKVYYFAYAGDLDPVLMAQRVGAWESREPALLEDWELVFSRRSGAGEGQADANLRPQKGAHVEGALYLLREDALEALDCAESVPVCAQRQYLTVRTPDGDSLQAWVYTAPEDWIAEGRPACRDLKHFWAGQDVLSEAYYQKICLIPACECCELVAVYGSLRQGRKWHFLLSDSPMLGVGWTQEAYALYLADYPCVDKHEPVSPIRVEVYRVNQDTLSKLDDLEEHPFVYVREKVPVQLDTGLEVLAWVYFFPHPQGHLLTHGDYALEFQN